MHEDNCFITLTYDEEHLPANGSLDREAFPAFMKRLRKRLDPLRVRYFQCGEYGAEFRRPHYHACIFGTGFADRYRWALRNGRESFRSATLEAAWGAGQAEIGALTFESAAYVARYCTKKVTGAQAAEHYVVADARTGEISALEPEYATMSRRPGIGRGWIEKYHPEVFPLDEVISRGHPATPPRYYLEFLKETQPEAASKVSSKRRRARRREDETPERLQVREVCANARVNLLSRRYENEAV